MSHFRQPAIFRRPHKQHGAALMVMLVIMIVGAAALLVNAFNSSATKLARDKTTANALAQAKAALIGYAVSDANHPGNLPCPDVDDDGKLTMNIDYVGSNCTSPIGRLPWVTLGLPELRDGAGEHLWYALSKPYAAIGTPHINSETQGTLAVSGSTPASSVIAIVFAPGQILTGASRSPTVSATCSTSGTTIAQSLCAANYLEGSNAALNTWAAPNLTYQSANTSSTFNDQMMLITHKGLMPLVEKRIAREARICLESYASAYFNMYPWAVPTGDTTYYASQTNTFFGRLPLSVTYSATVQQLLDDLAALQRALNVYSANPYSQANIDALATAGDTLNTDASNADTTSAAPLDTASLQQLQNAGTSVKSPKPNINWSASKIASFVSQVQTQINQAITFIMSENHGGITPGGWPAGCKLIPATYWTDWKNQVFYQVSAGYAPSASLPLSCGSPNTCLSIGGSGNTAGNNGSYRATVIVAGEMLPGQSPRSPTANPPNTYLANTASEQSSDPAFVPNAHDSSTPATTFITYKPSDPYYQNVNDLVLCLDGGINCK